MVLGALCLDPRAHWGVGFLLGIELSPGQACLHGSLASLVIPCQEASTISIPTEDFEAQAE